MHCEKNVKARAEEEVVTSKGVFNTICDAVQDVASEALQETGILGGRKSLLDANCSNGDVFDCVDKDS